MESTQSIKNLQRLLQFTLALSAAPSFEDYIMDLLTNVIEFDSGFFISLNQMAVPDIVIGYNIDHSMIKSYKDTYYKYDPLLDYSYRMNFSSQTEHIMAVSIDTHYNQLSGFIKYMSNDNLSYGILMTINSRGDGIRLFRKASSNMFSDEDMEVCKYLCRILGSLYETHLRNKKYYLESNLFKIAKGNMLFGYIIFDQNFSIVFSNKLANERIYKITQKAFFHDMISDFILIIKNSIAANIDRKSDITFYEITQAYILEIIINQNIDELGNIRNYYITYIYDKNWFGSMARLTAEKVIEQYNLTEREKQLVKLIYKGLSNNQIADYLYISTHTVKDHLKNIFRKLDLSSRGELMAKIFDECK